MPDQDTVRIPLHARDGSVRAYTLIDADDADWVSQWRWFVDKGYVIRMAPRNGRPQRKIRLHRALLGLIDGDGREGDHINRDRLDNRRSNLRATVKAGNMQNVPSRGGSSAFRGVYWHKINKKWTAKVVVGGRKHHLGYFSTEQEAATAARNGRASLMPYATD